MKINLALITLVTLHLYVGTSQALNHNTEENLLSDSFVFEQLSPELQQMLKAKPARTDLESSLHVAFANQQQYENSLEGFVYFLSENNHHYQVVCLGVDGDGQPKKVRLLRIDDLNSAVSQDVITLAATSIHPKHMDNLSEDVAGLEMAYMANAAITD